MNIETAYYGFRAVQKVEESTPRLEQRLAVLHDENQKSLRLLVGALICAAVFVFFYLGGTGLLYLMPVD